MRPHQSHLFGFAPASMSSFAVSKWKLSMARNSGVTPFGSGRSTFGAGLEQRTHALEAALARGEQQRRQAAERPVHAPRLAGDLARPIVDDGARVDVGAMLDEQLDHRGLVLRRGPHERRLLAPALARVDVGAVLDEHFGGGRIAAAGDDHQRRLPIGAGCVDRCAGFEQSCDDGGVADRRGFRERRRAELVRSRDVGARRDQSLDEREVVVVDGPVQRRRAVGRFRVDVDAILDRGERDGGVVRLRCAEQVVRGVG